MLPARWAGEHDRLRRFEQEARATAALSHPNILAIHDVGEHEGSPYLVEELLAGEPLSRRIQAGDLTVGRSVGLGLVEGDTGQRRRLGSADEIAVGFTPDGRRLLSRSGFGEATVVHVWALPEGRLERPLTDAEAAAAVLAGDRLLVVAAQADGSWRARHLPLDGLPPEQAARWRLPGASTAWSPDATGTRLLTLEGGRLVQRRLDDLAAPGVVLCTHQGAVDVGAWDLSDRAVTWDATGELRLWDLAAGGSRALRPCRRRFSEMPALPRATTDSRTIVGLEPTWGPGETSSLRVLDLATGETRELASHGNALRAFALDPGGRVLVTAGVDGVVRVGPLSGGEPHLLVGHRGPMDVAVSPDGRRSASGGIGGTTRLWLVPDLSRPPLRTVPHAERLAKLRSLTNLRAAPDPGSDSGWKVGVNPFPGWATVPEWQPQGRCPGCRRGARLTAMPTRCGPEARPVRRTSW